MRIKAQATLNHLPVEIEGDDLVELWALLTSAIGIRIKKDQINWIIISHKKLLSKKFEMF